MKKNLGSLLLLILLGSKYLFSQSTTGSIEGWILDVNDQPVVSANILVSSTDLQIPRGTPTDERGYFSISALPVGIYTALVSHISYKQVKINDIVVSLGQTTSLGEIHLEKGSIETDEVIVASAKPMIDARSTIVGKSLSSEQFTLLPIERNYFHIAELLPHANLSFKGDGGTNFAGGTGVENRYFVDGAEVSTPTTGYLFFELPYNFIRQVEIQTGGYQAEFPSSLGGIVNTVTHSGGNEFHGTVFGFFTNNNFSNSPRISFGQPPKGDYSNYDFGFGFGGPLIKNSLWYYIAYDPSFEAEDVYVNGLGNRSSYNTKHKLAGKLTWNVDQNNMLTLSIAGNPVAARNVYLYSSELEVINPEYCTQLEKSLYLTAGIKGVHSVSDELMLESVASVYIMDTHTEPINEYGRTAFYEDFVNGTASGGLGILSFNPFMYQINTSVKGTLGLEKHIIKGGLEYSNSSTTRDDRVIGLQRYPDSYLSYDYSLNGTVSQHNISFFIQDSWQISRQLCLNAGIRWDPQILIASDGTVAQKITDQFQPRIGIIYQPGEPGIQKIAASYGRFYEPLQLSLSTFYHIQGAYYNYIIYPNDPGVDTSGAFYVPNLNPFVTDIPNVEGQYYNELSLGYERLILLEFKIGIRGIYRWLGQGIEDGVATPEDQAKYETLQVYGNPGSGMLAMLPKMKREYTALEFTIERLAFKGFNFLISYVLSRNRGNYDGLAETSDVTGGANVWSNATNQFGIPERMVNADGLLPNDRTHVIKFFGSYAFNFGLTMGVVFQYMSGTPLNELGYDAVYHASTFLRQRGTAGRTPSLWDLNFRFMYDISKLVPIGRSVRMIADILHVASQRTEIHYDQYHYLDYEQQYVNPNYMVPVQFQPPMSVRIGMEVNF